MGGTAGAVHSRAYCLNYRVLQFGRKKAFRVGSLGWSCRNADGNWTFLAIPLYIFWRTVPGKVCTEKWPGMSSSHLHSYFASDRQTTVLSDFK